MPENALVSLEIEKNCIAGLLRYPLTVTNLPSNVGADDFYIEVNKIIFSIIKALVIDGKKVEPTLIAERVKNLGISLKEDFSIYEHVEALSLIQISQESVLTYFEELKKYSICRELDTTTKVIQKEIRANLSSTAQEIITKVDGLYNHHLNLFEPEKDQIVDVFSIIEDVILKQGENPQDEMGLVTPYPIYNKYYGGYRPGNVYVFASRPGQGKSTYLSQASMQMARTNKKIKVLYLDTEMETKDVMLRMTSSLSGVPFWYLDTGNYIKNPDMVSKVQAAMKLLRGDSPNFYHKYVANVNVDEIISIIRRWYYTVCKRNDDDAQAIIVYDYLKMTGERLGHNWQEHQVIGDKVNKLKDIVTQIHAPLLTAIQINRTGSNSHKDGVSDDESVIALSDRIQWFCTYLGIFRRKTLDEFDRDGPQYGTHLLTTLKGRFQGRESQGHMDWVKIERNGDRPTYRPNYINYFVDNFAVQERSCLRDMIIARKNIIKGDDSKFRDFYEDDSHILEFTNKNGEDNK